MTDHSVDGFDRHYCSTAWPASPLCGRTGDPRRGRSSLAIRLRLNGFDPTSHRVAGLEFDRLRHQVRSGGMDAFCMDHAMVAALEQRGEVRVVADTRSLKGTLDMFGGPMPGAVVCASAGYIQQHPDVCQATANAVVRALKWLRTAGPSDLIKALSSVSLDAERVNYLAALEKSRDGFSGDGVLSDAAAATALAAVSRLDARVSLSRARLAQLFTNEFALRAKARFRV